MPASAVTRIDTPRFRNKVPQTVEVEIRDRINPGIYSGYIKTARNYYDAQFQRYVCHLTIEILDDSMNHVATVPLWWALGSGNSPKVGRRSFYWKEWLRAGGNPSSKDTLDNSIFTGRYVKVQVEDSVPKKADAFAEYISFSKATKIVYWETGPEPDKYLSQICNHTSGFRQSEQPSPTQARNSNVHGNSQLHTPGAAVKKPSPFRQKVKHHGYSSGNYRGGKEVKDYTGRFVAQFKKERGENP